MKSRKLSAYSWVVLLTLCLAAGSVYCFLGGNGTMSVAGIKAEPADTFLLLRMPEITTQRESGIETMERRMDEWFTAVRAAGYRPMLLSDVLWRLRHDLGVPERTVVLFYSPYYRKTCEIVSRIHARHRFPAVALTDKSALDRSDRRYLTFHAIRAMNHSGAWNAGFIGQQGEFRIEDRRHFWVADAAAGKWAPIAGALAVNRKGDEQHLNYLNINADWSADELVNRLQVENPAYHKVYLSKALIHGREWGVALDTAPAPFDLRPPTHRRGTKLFWLGTAGCRNFTAGLTVGSFDGELWLQLLYDEAAGSGLYVVIGDNRVVVEEWREKKAKRLLSLPSPPGASGRREITVTVQGNHVSIDVNRKRSRVSYDADSFSDGRGVVQLYLTGRLRGVAYARNIQLVFTPLEAGGYQ